MAQAPGKRSRSPKMAQRPVSLGHPFPGLCWSVLSEVPQSLLGAVSVDFALAGPRPARRFNDALWEVAWD